MAKIKMDFMDSLDRTTSGIQRIPVPDCRGLTIQVTGKPGAPIKSWIFRFRLGRETQGNVTIGRYPECSIAKAYAKADTLRLQVQAGSDPRESRNPKPLEPVAPKATPMTVDQLLDRYEANKMGDLAESTRSEYQRMFRTKVRTWADSRGRIFGTRPAIEVTYTDAEDLLNACRKKAERTATLVVIKMTNVWDYGRDIQELPDVRNLWSRQTKSAINERDRRLSEEELRILGHRLKACSEPEEHVIAYQLFLLAGMRHSNLSRCRWEWVDLESQWILIPKLNHKTGKKSGKPLQVLLSSYAVNLLKRLKALQDGNPDLKGSPWLYPAAGDKSEVRDDLQDPWVRITGQQPKCDKRRKAPAKVVTPLFGEGADKECHIHDLRRTLASVLSDLGYKAYADQVLGHANKSVTDIYTRTAVKPLLAMVEEAGKHIMTHLGFLGCPATDGALLPQVCCPAVVPKTLNYLLTSSPSAFVSTFETIRSQ